MNTTHALVASLILSLSSATVAGCSAPTEDAGESSDDVGEVTFRIIKEKRQISTVDGPIVLDTSVVRAKTANAAMDAAVNGRITAMVEELVQGLREDGYHADAVVAQAVSLNYAGLVTVTQTVTWASGHSSRRAITFDLRKPSREVVTDFGAFVNAQGRKILSERCVKQSCTWWLESTGVRVYSRSHDGASQASSVVPYSLLSGSLLDARLKRLAGESGPR